jgi:hypothetical protein
MTETSSKDDTPPKFGDYYKIITIKIQLKI